MSKVYVVTQGDYSDYHIVGIFTDKAHAEKIAEWCSTRWDKGEVEEYDLDPCFEEFNQGLRSYYIRMNKSGNVIECFLNSHLETKNLFDCGGNLVLYCWARDQEHAVKIANERRVQMIASGEWK